MPKYLIIIFIVIFSCEEPISPEIPLYPPDDLSETYQINPQSINSGLYTDRVTINWGAFSKSTFENYHIFSSDLEILDATITNQNINSLEINIPINSFHKIYIQVNTESEIFNDSITVFTRSIKPISSFTAVADSEDWSTLLEWDVSNEEDSLFKEYEIYRTFEDPSPLNNLNNCDCKLDTLLTNRNTSSFTDTTNIIWGGFYYYLIKTIAKDNNFRNSIIAANAENISYNPNIIEAEATNSEHNKITLNWEHNLVDTSFYQIEIWRSESIDENPVDGEKLVTIINYEKNSFEDYDLIQDGMSMFYKIKLIDNYGNEINTPIIIGNSHP